MLWTVESGGPRSTPSSVAGLADGRRSFATAFATALRPPPRLSVAEWAERYRYISPESGSPYPGKWSNALVPYLIEPMEVLSLHNPAREVWAKKSAQTGFTETAINLVLSVIDQNPAPILYVLPSLDEASKFNKIKLQPSFDVTPRVRRKVAETKSRDEDGSTGAFKRFRGGFMILTGANSSKGLQMISARVKIDDEVSEFPVDAGGRGDPVEQGDVRQLAYDEVGYKRFRLSTPGIKGACRVSVGYEASDQRKFYVPCPHCGIFQVLAWKHMKWRSETAPHGAWYQCQCGCATPIEHHHKREMVRHGVWLKTYADEDAPPDLVAAEELPRYGDRPSRGRHSGFHIWQAYSPFVSWDSTVAKFIDAKDNPRKLKTFVQQALGEEWEERGEAPEWEKLYERRLPYRFGTVPLGGLVITAGCDVQKNGIFFEVVAWGAGQTSWVIDAGFLEGDPAETDGGVWDKLSAVYGRRYLDAFGNSRGIEAFAVDSGYLSNQVYHWTRSRALAYAVDGRDGWQTPPIGTPSKVDITLKGKKLRRGALLWPVGTWSLKGELYANLRKPAPEPGAEQVKPGFCHFGEDLDKSYFQQLTAEFLKEKDDKKGRIVRIWHASGPNHFHDCRIYSMAMAEQLGLARMGPADWAQLAAKRNVADGSQRDLVTLMTAPTSPSTSATEPLPPPPVSSPPAGPDTSGGAPRPKRRVA
jgi:phage terminase large subunit GpA-like protein